MLSKKICNHKKCFLYIFFLLLISIFFVGFFVGKHLESNRFKNFISSFKSLREDGYNYKLINPLLGTISAPATDVGIFSTKAEEISSYLEKEKEEGNLSDYSFYFRDLSSPLWFGLNENKSFVPASLFKLPIAIAAYKQGENDESFLNKTFIYTQEISDINKNNQTNEESSLIIGKEYSTEDLIEIMLEMSDNGAKNLLIEHLDKKYIEDLFSVLMLIDPLGEKSYEISSRKYSLFLRLLYNSSYINMKHSENILSLLSKSTFKDGVVAGVPANIVVAHKFGVHDEDGGYKALHDCGIVYHKERPYVICFMTQGKNAEVLFKIISHVSKIIYESQDIGDL